QRVRGFAANVKSATNLGGGSSLIFSKVELMASAARHRLMSEITETNTFTAWGFREHKQNFALLIRLGHADSAASAFVKERSVLIRRSLRMVESTSDPLSYVKAISEVFFRQISNSVMAFLKLFCGGSASQQAKKSSKGGKSAAYMQVYAGVAKSGTAPFCRLSIWMDQQVVQYAALVGRQIRSVNIGAQLSSPLLLPFTASGSGPGETAALLPGGFRLGPMASSLFAMVSLMLEESFVEAEALDCLGFPVGASLCSQLVQDIAQFLDNYTRQVKDNLVDVIGKELYEAREYKLMPPEALLSGTEREQEEQGVTLPLIASASIMIREV
ncbi:unnamed protein product, partial [Chrysoparadoxa australica]